MLFRTTLFLHTNYYLLKPEISASLIVSITVIFHITELPESKQLFRDFIIPYSAKQSGDRCYVTFSMAHILNSNSRTACTDFTKERDP